LKVWSFARPLPLSERVPVLENMGFGVVDERTYHIEPQGRAGVWLHDMFLTRADGGMIDLMLAVPSLKQLCGYARGGRK
jgi:glutamate dehydrogenase